MKERSLRLYKEKLAEELEKDCSKKLMVGNLLYVLLILWLAVAYYRQIIVAQDFKNYSMYAIMSKLGL